MSMLIKGINVHRGDCWKCPCLDGEYGDCNVLKKDVHYISGNECPLIELPTIDPVKHGKWIFDREVRFDVCSECGLYGVSDMKYCPNCGARMDKGDEDD